MEPATRAGKHKEPVVRVAKHGTCNKGGKICGTSNMRRQTYWGGGDMGNVQNGQKNKWKLQQGRESMELVTTAGKVMEPVAMAGKYGTSKKDGKTYKACSKGGKTWNLNKGVKT